MFNSIFQCFKSRKGTTWVKNWMSQNCLLIEVADGMPGSLNEFNTFNAQFHGAAGKKCLGTCLAHTMNTSCSGLRFTLVGLDATLWPANSTYLTAAIGLGCGIVNMAENNLLHVQLPQLQSSTTAASVLKHRRSLEDMLIAQKLDISNVLLLRFVKPDSQKNDSRRLSQNCIAAVSTNYKSCGFTQSEAFQHSLIGPAPLIKASQMLGYDVDEGSMSAGLRTEQILGFSLSYRLFLRGEIFVAAAH